MDDIITHGYTGCGDTGVYIQGNQLFHYAVRRHYFWIATDCTKHFNSFVGHSLLLSNCTLHNLRSNIAALTVFTYSQAEHLLISLHSFPPKHPSPFITEMHFHKHLPQIDINFVSYFTSLRLQ